MSFVVVFPVAPVMATYPLFTLAIGHALSRRVTLSWQQVAGVALTVIGVVLLVAG